MHCVDAILLLTRKKKEKVPELVVAIKSMLLIAMVDRGVLPISVRPSPNTELDVPRRQTFC